MKKLNDVLKEISEASMGIPFENSQFQTDYFVVNAQLTPTRAYRAILLRLNDRLRALNSAKYNLAREDIDIEELKLKIDKELKKGNPNSFNVRRWELDINEKTEGRVFTIKLIADALEEVKHLYELFKKFPRYTRAQFESEERKYFEISLKRQQAGLDGAPSALIDMGVLNLREKAPEVMGDIELEKVLKIDSENAEQILIE